MKRTEVHTVIQTQSDSDIVQEDPIKITLLPMEAKGQITISQVPC